MWIFWIVNGAGDGVRVLTISIRSFTESFIKIQQQDSTYPPSLFLESWMIGLFLMELDMVFGYSKYQCGTSLKVSSRSNIRNLVKINLYFSVTDGWTDGTTDAQTS